MQDQVKATSPRRMLLAAALGLLLGRLLAIPPARANVPPPALPPDGDRWATTRASAIHARRAEQPPLPPTRVERIYASPTLGKGDAAAPAVCVLVHPDLYPALALSLDRWAADVEHENWSALVYSATFADPPALRAHLASIPGLRGCLIVGDFPIPWFRWTDKEFPFDLYYMDLDGVWHDDDGDGLYEDHTGDTGLEIWIGRLTAGNLTFGRDEPALVDNYFDKNHAYRSGELPLPPRALAYVDDPWASGGATGLGQALSLLYPDTTLITDNETTRPDDYGRRLAEYYAWVHLIAHSTAYGHFFSYHQDGTPQTGVIYNENIYDIDPHAFFYNFFACGVARYTERDYMAGWYVFADTYGLAAIGSTSGGGMVRDWPLFYEPLAQGKPLGDAFLDWYAGTPEDRGFHYGLALLGDPTLLVDTREPPGEPPATLALTGPASISIGRTAILSATVEPASATPPLRYTWHVTGKLPVSHTGGSSDSASCAWWSTPGVKTVAVTATNPFGSVSATHTLTVRAPALASAPRVFSETLPLGSVLTRTLVLSNDGDGELVFRLAEADQAQQAGIGPDPFGYTYLDSNQPHGPAYDWIEIAPPAGGSGTQVEALSGVSTGYAYPIALPFVFPYYGAGYDRLAIHSDGVLSWSNRPANPRNLPLPGARGYEITRFLAPFWDDLAIEPGAVYVQDLGSAFVIEYHRVSRQGDLSDPGSWEVVLYDTGSILYQYQDVDLGGTAADQGQSATIGIQGDAGTALQYAYNAPALSPGLAICFAYPGQLPDCSVPVDRPWLSASPSEGAVAPSGRRSVELVLDARAPHVTEPGRYHAALVALTNDLQQPLLSVPVTFTVVPAVPPRTLFLPFLSRSTDHGP